MKKQKFETTCWIWPYGSNESGYGSVQKDGQYRPAHQLIYTLLVGPVPFGCELDHLCRTRLCVNPTHLQPVTHAVNCQRGRNSKLNGEDIAKIRSLAGKHSHLAISKMFGVSRQSITSIMKGERWANDGQPENKLVTP